MTKANDQLKAILKAHAKRKKVKLPKALSVGEETLARDLKLAGIKFEREVVFAPPRKFAFDFVVRTPDYRIAVEVDGGTAHGKGRHSRSEGYERDCDKGNLANVMGWCVLHFTTKQVKDGTAIAFIRKALDL